MGFYFGVHFVDFILGLWERQTDRQKCYCALYLVDHVGVFIVQLIVLIPLYLTPNHRLLGVVQWTTEWFIRSTNTCRLSIITSMNSCFGLTNALHPIRDFRNANKPFTTLFHLSECPLFFLKWICATNANGHNTRKEKRHTHRHRQAYYKQPNGE